MSNTVIRSRIDENEKVRVEKIFSAMGITTSEALRMFVRQVILHRGMPFELKIPNATTLAAIKKGPQPGDQTFDTAEELFDDLDI